MGRTSSSLPGSCLLAAERIHFWLGRDRDHLFPYLLAKVSCQDLLMARKCDLVKVPKIPSQVQQLPLYGFQMRRLAPLKGRLGEVGKEKIDLTKKEKEPASAINRSAHQTQCCVNQKTPYLHFEESCPNDLTATRVFDCRFKEHFLVSRRLRSINKNRQSLEKHRDFVPLNPQKETQESLQDRDFWEEMIRAKERPIFQRVTIS